MDLSFILLFTEKRKHAGVPICSQKPSFIEQFIILQLLYLLYIYMSDWKTLSKQFQIEKGHCEAIQATKNGHENIITSSDLLE